jgi:ferrous iron transport protein B
MKRQLLHWNKENGDIPTLKKTLRIVLVGNPNSGKSSLFNHLTGLNQKIGNFPGVTVDKKSGFCKINEDISAEIIDLPGTYSIYPRSLDERVVFDILSGPDSTDYPDLAVVIVDLSNLKRNLLLFTQIKDLGIPVVLALNMADVAEKAGLKINLEILKEELGAPVIIINARKGTGLKDLKNTIADASAITFKPFYEVYDLVPEIIDAIKLKFPWANDYQAYQLAQQFLYNSYLSRKDKEYINEQRQKHGFDDKKLQSKETIRRYQLITEAVSKATEKEISSVKDGITHKADKILTHKYWGYLIFLGTMFFVFQAIFAWAEIPMEFIDYMFSALSAFLSVTLPDGPLNDLLTQGVIPGVAGILIFIPQIAILFVFISILEESGYMSRVVFLMDKIMRKVGLTGKSVVPLISGVACAIPAIMATRGIENWKDRIITILVTPLMSCSARIPVYTILIALVVPSDPILGFINLQGLALLGMYLLGFLAVVFSAFVIKLIIRQKERSYFVMELPDYKMPRWKNVGFTIVERVKVFVFEAGKIIIAISIVLWVLASYGPGDRMERAEETITAQMANQNVSEEEFNNRVQSYKLEHSYAGIFGKTIEPVIKPLGYDWKIGIALITSFAAREVFVGTMATIYSVGANVEDESTIKSRMQSEINPETGGPMYTPAMAFSLLVFYAFAMQCMSTLAIVYRETKNWRWPAFQLVYLTTLAYLSALLVYNLFK